MVLILAHRGAHDPESAGIRENTVAAFRRAAVLGADGVELDVRRSGDGALVVHHDPVLPDGRTVGETTRAELPDWVPTLAEALAACEGLALVNVELKASPLEPGFDPTYAAAPAVAVALEGRAARVLVSSFNLAALDAFHAVAPTVPTGWLTMTGFDQAQAAGDAAAGGHTALNPPDAQITAALVETVHGFGLSVVAWTVDDPERMAALAAYGVDVLVTDHPARAVAALRP
ncbi:MAG: glycerophosphodiester phosphodiesterase [Acidimicrobiales bacterium]